MYILSDRGGGQRESRGERERERGGGENRGEGEEKE